VKKLKLLLLALSFVFAAATAVAITHESLESQARPVEQCERTSHGTHLCSADDHCGVGHKCCDGHCEMVDTCG
jgi:hypothetical protein